MIDLNGRKTRPTEGAEIVECLLENALCSCQLLFSAIGVIVNERIQVEWVIGKLIFIM